MTPMDRRELIRAGRWLADVRMDLEAQRAVSEVRGADLRVAGFLETAILSLQRMELELQAILDRQ